MRQPPIINGHPPPEYADYGFCMRHSGSIFIFGRTTLRSIFAHAHNQWAPAKNHAKI